MNRFVVAMVLFVAASVAVGMAFLAGDAPETGSAAGASTTVPAPEEPSGAGDPTTTSGSTEVSGEPPEVVAVGFEIPEALQFAVEDWTTDWSLRTIELDELKLGIRAPDPRDRIAPLDDPAYESIASAAEWLDEREIGVRFVLDDVARFYPLRILTAHEIVNDEVKGVPFAVTYCPLCNTAVVFDRRVGDEVLRFGVSGLLRNSDLVMWDDRTVSLWQQITGEGIVGSFAGTRLELLPSSMVTWADFAAVHPNGEALSLDTGFGFNYSSVAYQGYSNRSAPYAAFFDGPLDERFPALERVVGVRVDEETKAFPFSVLRDERTVNDVLGGVPITVWWAPTGAADNFDGARPGDGGQIGTGIAFVREVDGRELTFTASGDSAFVDDQTGSTWSLFGEAIEGELVGVQLDLALHQNEFWFAWVAFNPGAPVHGG